MSEIEEFRVDKPMVLVNPNEGRPWKCSVWADGRRNDMVFEPWKRKRLPSYIAKLVLTEAARARESAKLQSESELEAYGVLISTKDVSKEIAANSAYINKKGRDYPGDGKPPRTRPWAFEPAVDLGSAAGMKQFEQAIELFEKDPNAVSEEVIRDRENMTVPKYKAHEDLDWDKMAIYEWIMDNGGMASTNQDIKDLFERAMRLFKSKYEWLKKRDITPWDTEFDCKIQLNQDGDLFVWPKAIVNEVVERKKTAALTG